MRKFLSIVLIALPALVFALEYTDVTEQYDDAPFSMPEAAAINVLTNLGVVEGNPMPDGGSAFEPNRPLNRAEFAKIVFLALGSDTPEQLAECFPDVQREWFSVYVCSMKQLGAIRGYPDGLFHPERNVNYAEALKILAVSFGYQLDGQRPKEHWYLPYARAAQKRKTALPISVAYDAALTRGQMARLTAAFVAESLGELREYRDFERGIVPATSSSSIDSSVSSESSASESSLSSVSSSVSPEDLPLFPARSHFLVAGERSEPIAGATFFADKEPMIIKRSEVILKADIDGIDAMYIVDSDGVELGQIYLDHIFDNTDKTYRGALTGNYRIPKGEQRVLGVEIRMKERDRGGTSEEIVQVHSFKITTEGEWSLANVTSGTLPLPNPKHQTSMGRITAVRNAGEGKGTLPIGTKQQLASFRIDGQSVSGATLRVEHLEFQVSKTSDVSVANWELGTPESGDRHPCSIGDDTTVNCLSIPSSFGTLTVNGSRTFQLYGDTALASGATSKSLQISLNLAGDFDQLGAVRWTDGTGHFNWVELHQPLARGTDWK